MSVSKESKGLFLPDFSALQYWPTFHSLFLHSPNQRDNIQPPLVALLCHKSRLSDPLYSERPGAAPEQTPGIRPENHGCVRPVWTLVRCWAVERVRDHVCSLVRPPLQWGRAAVQKCRKEAAGSRWPGAAVLRAQSFCPPVSVNTGVRACITCTED